MPELPFGYGVLAIAAITVVAGYLIFAITGFGAPIVTVPVLSHFLPLTFVLPLAVLLDVGASLVVGVRFQRHEASIVAPAAAAAPARVARRISPAAL